MRKKQKKIASFILILVYVLFIALLFVGLIYVNVKSTQITQNTYTQGNKTTNILLGKEQIPNSNLLPSIYESKRRKVKKEDTIDNRFSKKELDVLYRIVEAEVTGGSHQGKKNVAGVIFNRLKSDEFPDSIQKIVFQKNQFSPILDGRFSSVKVQTSTIKACREAYEQNYDTSGALYFDSCAPKVSWASQNKTYLFTDDCGHSFYK